MNEEQRRPAAFGKITFTGVDREKRAGRRMGSRAERRVELLAGPARGATWGRNGGRGDSAFIWPGMCTKIPTPPRL